MYGNEGKMKSEFPIFIFKFNFGFVTFEPTNLIVFLKVRSDIIHD